METIDTNSANDRIVKYPFGEAEVISITAAAEMTAEVKNTETLIEISEMGAGGTLDLSVNAEMPVGANLTIKASADGTARTLTLGDGFSGKAYSVTASKHAALSFKYDGSSFVNTAAILLD